MLTFVALAAYALGALAAFGALHTAVAPPYPHTRTSGAALAALGLAGFAAMAGATAYVLGLPMPGNTPAQAVACAQAAPVCAVLATVLACMAGACMARVRYLLAPRL